MLSTIALFLIAFHPQPLPLDNLSLNRAHTLDGKRVLATILVAKPPFTLNGSTIVDADDKADGIERTAILVGRRLDAEGKRIVVAGTLRVIEHPARQVGQELLLPWIEIRVEEGGRK
jgi:hypothetical protein